MNTRVTGIMKRQSNMFDKVCLLAPCIFVTAAGTTKGGGVASTIKCGPEVFTQSRFDGALFDVYAHVVVVIRQKNIPRPWCSTEKVCGGVDIFQPDIGARCIGLRRI